MEWLGPWKEWNRIDEGCGGEGDKEEEGIGCGMLWGGFMLGYVNIQGGMRRNLRLVVEVVREKEISVMEIDMKGEGLGMSV